MSPDGAVTWGGCGESCDLGVQEMCVKYWPSGVGDPGVYGGYQVELSEEEKDRGGYITRRFKVSPVDKVKGWECGKGSSTHNQTVKGRHHITKR